MTDNFVINPTIDGILRGADIAELHCIKSFIEQLLDERKLNDHLARQGLVKGSPQMRQVTIDDLDISLALYNILKAAKLWTLADILEFGLAGLNKCRGLGKLRMMELQRELNRRGLEVV